MSLPPPPPPPPPIRQELLRELEVPAVSLHSGKPQRERLSALEAFKSGVCATLLATDVASRGLDIPTVDLVINFDLPMLARDYVHRVSAWQGDTTSAGWAGRPRCALFLLSCAKVRPLGRQVGRTARAGRSGWCLSLVTQYDVELVHKIEGLIDAKLEKYELPEDEVLKGITKARAPRDIYAINLYIIHLQCVSLFIIHVNWKPVHKNQ